MSVFGKTIFRLKTFVYTIFGLVLSGGLVQGIPPLDPISPPLRIIIPTGVPGRGNEPITLVEVQSLLGFVANFFVAVAPILLVIALISSGLYYMKSGASAEGTKKARAMFGYSVLGGLIIFGTGVIINTIGAIITRQFFCTFGFSIPGIINICLLNG